MTPIQKAARGEECTFAIVGVCNHDPATTVLCHLGSGTAKRKNDLNAAFGCSACHDAYDRRNLDYEYELAKRRDWYARRANVATLIRLVALGMIEVKGLK